VRAGKFLSKLGPFKWTLHNMVAHPLGEIIYLFGLCTAPFERISNWLHDVTIPDHDTGAGRG
jgi:hypothetical protein